MTVAVTVLLLDSHLKIKLFAIYLIRMSFIFLLIHSLVTAVSVGRV